MVQRRLQLGHPARSGGAGAGHVEGVWGRVEGWHHIGMFGRRITCKAAPAQDSGSFYPSREQTRRETG